MVQFQNEEQTQQFTSKAWIGLYNDVNSWRWSYGNELLGSLRLWKSYEPNNADGHQECGTIDGTGWNDRACTSTYPSVCFDDTKTGTDRYIYINNTLTWSEAQSYCRTYHTDLVSVKDETANSLIGALTSGWTWTGLFRDSWKWIDHTKISVITWQSGEPDNYMENETCGYVNNSQAADEQCTELMPFFCYSEAVIPRKQQIMKVAVQSKQNVNDPALKLAILEQIKQKLKDHGMVQNMTAKWKEQPDGKVFHKKTEKEEF
ncbi:C-type mannose receptor 2-like [Tachysurus fulvidraco]|uniref:C-type mannose receptor 2-like n=1 Tax=Tachysurus fulvidraco TaxID=1234273 RepID=UPI001FEDA2F6|nr:C-type mannose receptor 2-like [Tachysurus fulvidraco]